MGISWTGACLASIAACMCLSVAGANAEAASVNKRMTTSVPGPAEVVTRLDAGQLVEISARVLQPSQLTPNARVRVKFALVEPQDSAAYKLADKPARAVDAEGIYTAPTANWSKLLHALDGDVYLLYRAPLKGTYRLSAAPADDDVSIFDGKRWREAGKVAVINAAPRRVSWPQVAKVNVTLAVRSVAEGDVQKAKLFLEAEPNDTPEQAQPLTLRNTVDDDHFNVMGGSDDIEYFDNGRVGSSGDDWYRLEFTGKEPRLLSACLSIADQQVAARIRTYALSTKDAKLEPGKLLPIKGEYSDGKNPNERVHQQQEQHRIAINRTLNPGHVYFLRVEANTPGYDLELRIVKPAPFNDPRQAVRHALYDHIGQVDSWLANRPRGASVERRIRDTGNLLGTQCMSCHTQSGVWGPAIPFAMGYRPQNIQLFRNLTNICYQSMRPTNVLVDAANNTSLQPLDVGDGPAGTRVAGHSVVSLERYTKPRGLQSKQAIRAANFILQTSDPGGINAAGPGANVGRGVVFNYTGEVLFEAWKSTSEPKYFRALEEKARKTLEVNPKYTDDMCHRVELLKRYFPVDYVKVAAQVAKQERDRPKDTNRVPYKSKPTTPEEAVALQQRIDAAVKADLARLRAIQHEQGTWGFNPGASSDGGKKWTVNGNNKPEPSPTALALIAFQAAGFGPDDPTVAKGVKGLLKLQHPSGLWKGQSQTGFVSTSYAMHALSRLYPVDPPLHNIQDYKPAKNESLVEAIRRVRQLSVIEDIKSVPLMIEAAKHASPLVRYWAMIGLGATHTDAGVASLVKALGDEAKMVRVAAHWALRQTLIDNKGWDAVIAATKSKDDYVREAVLQTLLMRVDGVMPEFSIEWSTLTGILSQAMNKDSHPAVRAWAARAAWNWWVWNPPVRKSLNEAWVQMLSRPETNALVENAIRYQSQALFIANGHKANGSKDHQYKELAELFLDINDALELAKEDKNVELTKRLARRIVSTAATFYNTSGGDGGPGQMGYVTPGSGDLFGNAVLTYLKHFAVKEPDRRELDIVSTGLEGAANVPHRDLQQKLIDYSLNGPEELRPIAASSVSDPRSAQLVAVPELVEPLMQQVHRGANEPPRRAQLSDPILKMFGRVKWVIPDNADQQEEILGYLIPKFERFYTAEELKGMKDAAARAKIERRLNADWYVSTGLGDAFGSNPDLQLERALPRFADSFDNPTVARFWLPSVSWVLRFKKDLPEVTLKPGQVPPADPLEELRSRALSLFLTQLTETADPRVRELAVKLGQDTALRRNPEILTALDAMLKFEKREHVVKMAKNVLSTGRKNFTKDLLVAVKAEKPARFPLGKDGNPVLPAEFVDDFKYFRDYVTPEMNRVLRNDQRSCFACHGVPGRVPPLTLARPDDAGFLPVNQLLKNYRLLQDRIDYEMVEKSKLLRKPLNVQTGKEDGHQGGRRYQPNDPGYQILRKWALNHIANQSKLGKSTLPMTATQ